MLKERDVVLNELLKLQGAHHDALVQRYSLNLPNSRYAERIPGQLSPAIQKASAQELRAMLQAFYAKWYRPDNMALIIVGDFGDSLFGVNKRDQLLKEIESKFSQIPLPQAPLSHTIPSVDKNMRLNIPWQKELRTASLTHSDFDSDFVHIGRRTQFQDSTNFIDKKFQEIADGIYSYVIGQYLTRVETQTDSHLLGANDIPYPYR